MYYLCFKKENTPHFASAGKFLSKGGSVHPRRILDTAVLLLGCEGEYGISQNGYEHTLSKGCFQLLFPDTEHFGTKPSEGNHSHFWCHFYLPEEYFIADDGEISRYSEEKYFILPEFFKAEDYEKYFVIFNQMIDESEKCSERADTPSEICSCYVKILLYHLDEIKSCAEKGAGHTSKRAVISKVKEFLRSEACSGISAYEASEKLGYNPDHLSRLIKAETGMTLCAYLNSIRISRAKNLLQGSSMKICDIARSCGFSDEKYFMKLFKKSESITPSKYREAHFRIHINH